jgi:hypothetical protein
MEKVTPLLHLDVGRGGDRTGNDLMVVPAMVNGGSTSYT